MFPFASDSAYDYVAYDPEKLDWLSHKQRQNDKSITMLALRPSKYFLSACDSDKLVLTGLYLLKNEKKKH